MHRSEPPTEARIGQRRKRHERSHPAVLSRTSAMLPQATGLRSHLVEELFCLFAVDILFHLGDISRDTSDGGFVRRSIPWVVGDLRHRHLESAVEGGHMAWRR